MWVWCSWYTRHHHSNNRKISQIQKWLYRLKTRKPKCLISVHLYNLCGDILLPEKITQWYAEVRSAVRLHNQEVSFSVPRYRVLQMNWWSFPEEENQLLWYRYPTKVYIKSYMISTKRPSFLHQGKDDPYLSVSGTALFGTNSNTKYASLYSVEPAFQSLQLWLHFTGSYLEWIIW